MRLGKGFMYVEGKRRIESEDGCCNSDVRWEMREEREKGRCVMAWMMGIHAAFSWCAGVASSFFWILL